MLKEEQDKQAPPRQGGRGRTHPTMTDVEFQLLAELVRKHTGIHLPPHKKALLKSRLAGRIRDLGLTSYLAYQKRLKDPAFVQAEVAELTDAITTNLTSFFREPHHFDHLREYLRSHAQAGVRVRILCAGCSEGMEPYSAAIVATDCLGISALERISIVAMDIDRGALQAARKAVYDNKDVRMMDQGLLRAGFQRGRGAHEGKVRVKESVSRLVQFHELNMVTESLSPLGEFDIIFCRNVLIYFDPPTRTEVVRKLAAQLRPGGFIYLGHSESIKALGLTGWRTLGTTIYQPGSGREEKG
ncbi:MAG: protein-glutamate O-methyltransferase CheR [Planctomycetes bacterium]|nr:protein-glutamate O-methyltransferase CheR [Planctomycetota bacterium]